MNRTISKCCFFLLLAWFLAGCSRQTPTDSANSELDRVGSGPSESSNTPHPGRLVISPTFQQIGDSEDGGGIIRSMVTTMALMSTNDAEAKRLADLAHQPGTLATPAPETLNLSGIREWLTADQLPDATNASQVRTFGPWQLFVWGEGLEESTVALYRSNEFQFAWQGFALVTTGPVQPKEKDAKPNTWFEGPPAGTDLGSDGVPDILIYDYSGGAHCCATVKHIVCSDPPVLTAQISGWHCTPAYRDLDGDGRYEMIIHDASYAYWNACYAASPQPEVIFRIRNGHYEIAGDLMRSHAPAADKWKTDIKDLQHQLARYDQFIARRNSQTNENTEVKLAPEEEVDDNFFSGQAWRADGVCIPPAVWELLLNLIYTGQIDTAVNALDTMWPAGKPHKAEFANDLLGMIRGSWYGRHLPWFNELEKAFAQHYSPAK